jgi:hypothetical protein
VSYASGGWSPMGTGQRRPVDPLWTEATSAPLGDPNEPPNPAWTYLREGVLFRMQKMSFNHAMVVADKPQGRLPGPHAIAMLYGAESRASSPQARQFDIYAATRMFQDTDDERPKYNVRDLPQLLANLTEIAEYHYRAGGWDPVELADRSETMPSNAQFIGIGISSLGAPGQNWVEVRSGFGLQLPSHCDIRMTDGTWIEMSRDGSQSQTRLNCNRLLGYMSGFAQGPMIPVDYQPRPNHPHAWLDRLTGVIDAAYAERARRHSNRMRGR